VSFSNTMESAILSLLLENTNIANVGDSTGLRGSSVAGSVYVALHTADPGEAGDQTASECTFTGYARVAVARGSATWTASGTAPTQITNDATIAFAACSAGSNSATYFSVGLVSGGASAIIFRGALTAPLAISVGITPSFAAGTLVGTLD
jgi:hypothetical protein